MLPMTPMPSNSINGACSIFANTEPKMFGVKLSYPAFAPRPNWSVKLTPKSFAFRFPPVATLLAAPAYLGR